MSALLKTKVVIFDQSGARILVNPGNLEFLKRQHNVLVDPDLSSVRGIPPHLWKKDGENVVPLSPEEIANLPENKLVDVKPRKETKRLSTQEFVNLALFNTGVIGLTEALIHWIIKKGIL